MSMSDPSLHLYELTTRTLDEEQERRQVLEAFTAADALVLYQLEQTDPAWRVVRMRCIGWHETLTDEQQRQLWERRDEARAKVAQGSGR